MSGEAAVCCCGSASIDKLGLARRCLTIRFMRLQEDNWFAGFRKLASEADFPTAALAQFNVRSPSIPLPLQNDRKFRASTISALTHRTSSPTKGRFRDRAQRSDHVGIRLQEA